MFAKFSGCPIRTQLPRVKNPEYDRRHGDRHVAYSSQRDQENMAPVT